MGEPQASASAAQVENLCHLLTAYCLLLTALGVKARFKRKIHFTAIATGVDPAYLFR